ncbi:MAG: hypothetical protein U0556_19135 [Dehalococcoidia bacterium]
MRGNRFVHYLDTTTADWTDSPTGSGVRRLRLSYDPESGAFSQLLSTPAGFAVPEKPHFADSDHEVFLVAGEFAFDLVHPLQEGDYLYRPVGAVYGDGEHSETGGIQLISFGREAVKVHLEDPPTPWPGEYLIDQTWTTRKTRPCFVRSTDLPWRPSSLGYGIEEKRLRGVPGEPSVTDGPSNHSPWAADAAFLLRIPAGYRGPFPLWSGFLIELFVLSGEATIDEERWQRGGYTFGRPIGESTVTQDLVCYGRTFEELATQ